MEEFAASYEPFPRIGFQITKEPNSTDDLPSKETEQILIQWPELSPLLAKIQPVFCRWPPREDLFDRCAQNSGGKRLACGPGENGPGFPDCIVNILVVEDHGDTRTVLSGLLQHCGFDTVSANSVAEGLKLLAQTQVDVLLSDLGLPDGNGLELVAEAKKLQPGLVAIALTARASEQDIEEGERAGFDHYLTKPFDFHQLRTILNSRRESAA